MSIVGYSAIFFVITGSWRLPHYSTIQLLQQPRIVEI